MIKSSLECGASSATTTRDKQYNETQALAMMPELNLMTRPSLQRLRMILLVAACILVAETPLAAQVTGGTTYRVGAGDIIRLQIWRGQDQEPIQADLPVETSGIVYLPGVGGVQVAGKTVEELRQTLRESYKAVFTNAVVTTTPIFPVSVLGAVESPGAVEATPGMTLFDAISEAGGFTSNAKRQAIELLRGGQSLTIDGTGPEGSRRISETQLQSGDRIVVDTNSKLTLQIATAVLQAASFLATIYVALK
jgi:protein involved in polysaccharide export with SLBB domain